MRTKLWVSVLLFAASSFTNLARAESNNLICTEDTGSPSDASYLIVRNQARTEANIFKSLTPDADWKLLYPKAGITHSPNGGPDLISAQEDLTVDWSKSENKNLCFVPKKGIQFSITEKTDGATDNLINTLQLIPNPKKTCPMPPMAPPVPVKIVCLYSIEIPVRLYEPHAEGKE